MKIKKFAKSIVLLPMMPFIMHALRCADPWERCYLRAVAMMEWRER